MVKVSEAKQFDSAMEETTRNRSSREGGSGGARASGRAAGSLRPRSRTGSSAVASGADAVADTGADAVADAAADAGAERRARRRSSASETPKKDRAKKIGRYSLLEKIGQGGMGAVYRAYDPRSEQVVAVKVLLWGTMANRLERHRFLLEARAAAHLDHPGIVRVLDAGVHEGCPYFAMEYVSGPSLRAVLEEQGPIPVQTALRMLADISGAVHHAHVRGIVHRDLKPANILLQDGKLPRVIDFGIADCEHEEMGRLVSSGHCGGTPLYMSPEQASGSPVQTSPLSDVYSLGALFFHMLTGSPPQVGVSGLGRLRSVNRLERVLQGDGGEALWTAALHLSHKAMAVEPADRFASALELSLEADRLLGASVP